MPKIIDGKPLTRHEEDIWTKAFEASHSGAIATAAVQKYRAGRGEHTLEKKS